MREIQELILGKLKEEFEQRGTAADGSRSPEDDVWVMVAAAIPFRESCEAEDFLPFQLLGSEFYTGEADDEMRRHFLSQGTPTHVARVVLKTGDSDLVDGTDVYLTVNVSRGTADFVWQEAWEEGPPKFHGGTVEHPLAWVAAMAEPICVRTESPFQ